MRRITLLTIICIMAILPLGPALTVQAKAELYIKDQEFSITHIDNKEFELKLTFENKSNSQLQVTGAEVVGDAYQLLETKQSGIVKEGEEGTVTIKLKNMVAGKDIRLILKTDLGDVRIPDISPDTDPKDKEPDPLIPEKPEFEDTTKRKPILQISYNSSMPVANAGQTIKFALPIKNNSNHTAKNVMLNLDIGDSSKSFVFDRINLTHSLDSIHAYATKNVMLELKIDANTAAGVYPLTLNFDYTNEFLDAYRSSETAYIKVENTNTAPRLMLGQVKRLYD